MNIYAVLGYIAVCVWQPIQIVKIILTHDVSSVSPLAIATLAVGMVLIQIGFIKDKSGVVYLWGNGFAAVCSFVILGLYYVYV